MRPSRAVTTRRYRTGALALVAVGLTGCFTTAANFSDDAETFIEQDERLRSTLRANGQLGVADSLVDATCAEPPNRDEGTRFTCTATDSTGAVWEFEIEITGSNEYEVNLSRAPDGA